MIPVFLARWRYPPIMASSAKNTLSATFPPFRCTWYLLAFAMWVFAMYSENCLGSLPSQGAGSRWGGPSPRHVIIPVTRACAGRGVCNRHPRSTLNLPSHGSPSCSGVGKKIISWKFWELCWIIMAPFELRNTNFHYLKNNTISLFTFTCSFTVHKLGKNLPT